MVTLVLNRGAGNPSPSPARWPPSYSRPWTQPTSAGYTTDGHPGAEQGGGGNPSPSPARWPHSYSRPGTQPTSAGYTTDGHPGADEAYREYHTVWKRPKHFHLRLTCHPPPPPGLHLAAASCSSCFFYEKDLERDEEGTVTAEVGKGRWNPRKRQLKRCWSLPIYFLAETRIFEKLLYSRNLALFQPKFAPTRIESYIFI